MSGLSFDLIEKIVIENVSFRFKEKFKIRYSYYNDKTNLQTANWALIEPLHIIAHFSKSDDVADKEYKIAKTILEVYKKEDGVFNREDYEITDKFFKEKVIIENVKHFDLKNKSIITKFIRKIANFKERKKIFVKRIEIAND